MSAQPLTDPALLGERAKKQRTKESQERADLRQLLSTDFGRRFVWRLLGEFRLNESIWEPSARIHYLAGIQNCAHTILGWVVKVDPNAYLKMMVDDNNDRKQTEANDINKENDDA